MTGRFATSSSVVEKKVKETAGDASHFPSWHLSVALNLTFVSPRRDKFKNFDVVAYFLRDIPPVKKGKA